MITKFHNYFRYNSLQSPAADCNLHALVRCSATVRSSGQRLLQSGWLWHNLAPKLRALESPVAGHPSVRHCQSTVQVISTNEQLVIRWTRGGQTSLSRPLFVLCRYVIYHLSAINSCYSLTAFNLITGISVNKTNKLTLRLIMSYIYIYIYIYIYGAPSKATY